jgi:hypothetical protein
MIITWFFIKEYYLIGGYNLIGKIFILHIKNLGSIPSISNIYVDIA